MKDLLRRVALLARARYPLIQLVTHEEARVVRALQSLGETEALPVWIWTDTGGFPVPGIAFCTFVGVGPSTAALGGQLRPIKRSSTLCS